MRMRSKTQVMELYPNLSDILSGMPERIWDGCKILSLMKGEMLFESGNPSTHVYILCRGKVVILDQALSGSELKVVFVNEGNMIGEMEALSGQAKMRYNARASTRCEVIMIPLRMYLEWVESDPALARYMVKVLAKKLYDASTEVADYKQTNAIVRIATFIFSEKTGRLDMRRQEIAEICGVSVRTLNRCIKQLKEENLISIKKGKIYTTEQHKDLLGHSSYIEYTITDFSEEMTND